MKFGVARRKPVKASGSQIGKRTKALVTCTSCSELRSNYEIGTACPICSQRLVKFDSTGEWRQWLILKQAQELGKISNLNRQVRYPMTAHGGVVVGHFVLDFTFDQAGTTVYADYKGGAVTELALWKQKHFKAQYGTEVTTLGGR